MFLILVTSAFADLVVLEANPRAKAIDQRDVAKNACGPVSLLNAYRFSSKDWRAVTKKLKGSPEEQFQYLRRRYFSKFSSNAYLKQRWDEKNGIRPDDLCLGANEFHKRVGLPQLTLTSIFLEKNETQAELLQRSNALIKESLNNGFPPILHISRFAKIKFRTGGYRWGEVASHFVIINNLENSPGNLDKGFQFGYIDPWRGLILKSKMLASNENYYANDITNKRSKNLRKSPCLELDMPDSDIGINLVQSGQPHVLLATHLLTAKKAP